MVRSMMAVLFVSSLAEAKPILRVTKAKDSARSDYTYSQTCRIFSDRKEVITTVGGQFSTTVETTLSDFTGADKIEALLSALSRVDASRLQGPIGGPTTSIVGFLGNEEMLIDQTGFETVKYNSPKATVLIRLALFTCQF